MPFDTPRKSLKAGLLISAVVLVVIIGATLLAMRPKLPTPEASVAAEASPSPSPENLPSPSPTARKADQKPKPSPSPSSSPSNENKGSKVGSILKKAGRILKKPF